MTRFKEILPKVLPTGAALLAFLHRQRPLFRPPSFAAKCLPQHDVQQYEGMAKEIWDNRAQTGEDPQWAGRMFGGMPAYRSTWPTRHNWSKTRQDRSLKL